MYIAVEPTTVSVVGRDGRRVTWTVVGLEKSKPPVVWLHRNMVGDYSAGLNDGWLTKAPHWRLDDVSLLHVWTLAEERGIAYLEKKRDPMFVRRRVRKAPAKKRDPQQGDLF